MLVRAATSNQLIASPTAGPAMVKFNVVMKTDLFPVTTSDNIRINDIIQCLQSPSHVVHSMLDRSLSDPL